MEWELDDAAPTRLRNEPLPSDLEATRVFHDPSASPVVESSPAPMAFVSRMPREVVGEATLVFPLRRPVSAGAEVPVLPRVPTERRQLIAIAAIAFSITSLLISAALPFALSLI